jgi:hypothetical protein
MKQRRRKSVRVRILGAKKGKIKINNFSEILLYENLFLLMTSF